MRPRTGELKSSLADRATSRRPIRLRRGRSDALHPANFKKLPLAPRPPGAFASRRAALRAAKLDAKIPLNQQPDAVISVDFTDRFGRPMYDFRGQKLTFREYEFKRGAPYNDTIVIQEHSMGHSYGSGVGNQPRILT